MKTFVLVCLINISISTNTFIYAQHSAVTAEQFYEDASIFYEKGNLSLALDYLNESVSRESEFLEAYLLRAKVKELLHDISGAQTDYSIVLYIDPYLTDARFQRAKLYYQQNRYTDALADFHLLLQMPPGETTTVYFRGKNDANGFSTQNITTLQSNMNADIYNYIGLAHLYLEDLDSAGFYLDQAILVKPHEADFYVNRGLLDEAKADTLSAIKLYQKALSQQADHAVALNNLAKLCRKTRYSHLLQEFYDQAVAEAGTYQSYYTRGIVRQASGAHKSAIEDFDAALEMSGQNDEILLMRAFSKEMTSDLRGALTDYSSALKLNPLLEKANSNRGNVLYKLHRYEEAIRDFDRALSINPNNAKLYYNRGLALYLSGNKEKACSDLQKALEMDFTSALAPLDSYCEPIIIN